MRPCATQRSSKTVHSAFSGLLPPSQTRFPIDKEPEQQLSPPFPPFLAANDSEQTWTRAASLPTTIASASSSSSSVMYGLRSPHLASIANRSSISTDYSETASFVSTAPSNASSVVIGDFSVLCLHDYEPTDQDQLGFSKGDILAILKTEDTGWWAAAMGNRIGWVPRGYVEPISDAMAEALRTVRRDSRLTDVYGSNPPTGPSAFASGSSTSPRGSSDGVLLKGEDPWSHRRGSNTSSRTQSSEDHRQHPSSLASSRPVAVHSNGTGGFYTDYGDYRSHHGSTSSVFSGRGPVPVPVVGSPGAMARYSPMHATLSQEFSLPMSPGERAKSITASSGRRPSRDDDAQAYRNAKTAAAALPPYLKPDYGEGFLRLDTDGVVKSGTLEALVERLTVDPLKRSQETAYRTTFLMTYKTFTDSLTVFELLNERYLMDQPSSLTLEQAAEWKDRRLRPTQTRVLATLTEWVERYRLVKDEGHLVPKLKEFLGLIKESPKNALSAKYLLQTIEKHEAAVAASSLANASPPNPTSEPPPAPKRGLRLGVTSSSKSRSGKNELLRHDPLELAQHLTLVEYRLYAKVRPSECMSWPKMQKGAEVEHLLRFCTTSDRLVSWVKYSILKEDTLGKRADLIEFWIKVAEKCRMLNNISSMTALVAALASSVITRLTLTWAHSRGSGIEPLTRLTDPTNNFAAYRTFYNNVDTSCVPFIGIYLTQLVHYADQYREYLQVPLPSQTPTSVSPGLSGPSSPSSFSSIPSSMGSSPLTTTSASSHQHSSVTTITHINFTRLFKCAEVIHQMLRHQVKGYRQANASASATHPVPDPSQALGISLGVENAQVMTYVESMLSTGGVGCNPPPGLPIVSPPIDGAAGPVGAAEAWYWQRSSELQAVEAETSDIRKGLEAAGF